MWSDGIIEVNGEKVFYSVKHFEESSPFGIDGGRISKVSLRLSEGDPEWLANYDRGWDIEPKTEVARKAMDVLLKKYN